MKCPKCGGENPDNAFFCGECGAQIGSVFEAPEPAGAATIVPIAAELPPAPLAPPDAFAPPQPVLPPPSANAPGAGLLPPPQPAPGDVPPPAGLTPGYVPPPAAAPGSAPAGDTYQVPLAAPAYPPQPAPYVVPPPGTQPPPYPGYAPPPGAGYAASPAYGYAMPPDGNTSGMGDTVPVPPQTQGWSFAGCIPFGLFGFLNGVMLWAGLGLAGSLLFQPLYLVYAIYMGIKGRELAWRSRRFDSLMQYEDTMRAWNNWGIGCLAALILGGLLYFIFAFAIFGSIMSEAMKSGTP
jgi:hypothetical protein